MNDHNHFEPPQPFNQQPQGPIPPGPHPQGQNTPGPLPPEPAAPEEPKKNWFLRHKFLTGIGAILAIIIIAASLGGSDESQADPLPAATDNPNSADTPATDSPTTDSSGTDVTTAPAGDDDEAEDAPSPEPEEPAVGAFEPFTTTGSSDSVIALPEGVIEGLITATHEGSAHFAISAIDANNESTGDLAVNTIGSYTGTTVFGVSSLTDAAALQISADGAWEVTIAPLEDAPVAQLPLAGDSDAVYQYDGGASVLEISHQGGGHFSVVQTDNWFPSLLVNEIGTYTGSVPVKAGPNYLIIQADGAWTAG